MGKLLFMKMFRDMRRSSTAYLLAVLIVSIGFCGFSVLELCYDNLLESKNLFFEQSEFCDGFIECTDAPISQEKALKAIAGIEDAAGRLVQDVRVSGYGDGAELHLVTWSEGEMNRPVLSRGMYPKAGANEIIIGEGFSKAWDLEPGDSLRIAVGGRWVTMEIAGVGLTPENIYMIRDMSELFPASELYDAAFTSYETYSRLAGKTGHADSFLIRLAGGTKWEDVKDEIERVMKPYGMTAGYARGDQLAVSMVEEEIKQLQSMSGAVPLLFLLVAGVILYITLSRMAEQQRVVIGTMLAMGIPPRAVRLHYLSFGACTGLLGGFLGGLLGYRLAGPMADFYRMYFNLPQTAAPLSVAYLLEGTLGAGIFCASTSWMVAGRLGKIQPAAALRPPAPGIARTSVLERIPGFLRLFTVPGVMAVRSLSRNPKRTAMSLAGMSFAFMITATLVSMNSLFDAFIFDYWEETQRQDLTVQFERPVSYLEAHSAAAHPEVEAAEEILEFPVTLTGPDGKNDCTVQAIRQDSVLTVLFRKDGSQAAVGESGIVLTEHIARVLGVSAGDEIEVKVGYPKERVSRVAVTDVITQYMGSTAYMSLEGAGKVSDYRNACNGILLKAPASVLGELKERLGDAKGVASIQSRQGKLDGFRAILGSMGAIIASMSFLGVLISFAVIYISSLISFEELKRELSTLMMLGLKSRECLEVISTSQWILAVGAVIAGIPMAMAASRIISVTMASDIYTIPDFLDRKAVLQSIGLTALAVGASSYMMLRKLKKLVPADLLRERE